MQRTTLLISFVVIAHVVAASGWCAAPVVERLFPPGGQRGTTIELRVTGKFDAQTKAWCSRPDVKLALDSKNKKLVVTIHQNAVPGLCWLRLHNGDGVSAAKPFFIGTLPELNEKETNDRLDQSQRLKTSAVINGVLAKNGDVDCFAIDLKAGQTLVASMTANNILASPMDGVLQVVSPRGFVLEQNDDDRGFDPRVIFTAKRAGTYHVRAFAFPEKPNSSIRFSGAATFIYRLSISNGPCVDYAYPSAIRRGSSTSVKIAGWNLPPSLAQMDLKPAATSNAVTVWDARLANTTVVKVVDAPTSTEEEWQTAHRTQPASLPAVVTGRLSRPRETDVYRFRAKRGERLSIAVASRSLGFPMDPVLQLVDSSGKVVKRVETRSSTVIDETLAVTIRTDGEYRLEISDLHKRGGMRFVYRLSLLLAKPDFKLTLAADAFTLMNGKTLTIPVTVTRLKGYAGEIRIAVRGLPPGVSLKPAFSRPKTTTAKTVKLVFRATGKVSLNQSLPIRIRGRSDDKPPRTKAALAKMAGLTTETSDIWLTVRGSKIGSKRKPRKSAGKR